MVVQVDGNAIILLDAPPAYFQLPTIADLALETFFSHLDISTQAKPLRKRLPCLSEAHSKAASLANLSILISFADQVALSSFSHLWKKFQLPRIQEERTVIGPGHHFALSGIHCLNTWLGHLPPKTAFQVERMYRNGWFTPLDVLVDQNYIDSLRERVGESVAADMIGSIHLSIEDEEPLTGEAGQTPLQKHLSAIEKGQREVKKKMKSTNPNKEEGIFKSYHLYVTPSAFTMEGPLIDQSNDLLRRFPNFHDHFLRVSFREEDLSSLRYDRDIDYPEFVKECFLPRLREGIFVMGRVYQFLGYSSSALRDHGVWFVTPFTTSDGHRHDAYTIRASLGTFTECIRKPAKYGARLAQVFTATVPTIKLSSSQIFKTLPDRYAPDGTLFTDGVGTMSPALAEKIHSQHQKLKRQKRRGQMLTPSVFQFRLGGAKGVMVVDPRLNGECLCIRPSQEKFDAPDALDFNVASSSTKPMPMFLNRPLVQMLEHLGASSAAIEELQSQAVRDISSISESVDHAAEVFKKFGVANSFRVASILRNMKNLLQLDLGSNISAGRIQDPFLLEVLRITTADILRELKHRARIPVPGSYTLLGVADEWEVLNEGQIYAAVRHSFEDTVEHITGEVAVTRSPTMHPGDIQLVWAISPSQLPVDCPLLKLENCVVFACRGPRSLPSCLGGGDLDGDIYNIVVDKRLQPKINKNPASYTPVPPLTLEQDSTIDDVANFVVNYIASDILGLISTTSLAIADQHPLGPSCPDCLELAERHSHAVDFPKTGVPATMNKLPRVEARPDFLRPEYVAERDDRAYYDSPRLLGKLFRAIPEQDLRPQPAKKQRTLPESFTCRYGYSASDPISKAMLRSMGSSLVYMHDGEVEEEMFDIWSRFALDLNVICHDNTLSNRGKPLSEEEAFVGAIIARIPDRRLQKEHLSLLKVQTEELAREIQHDIEGDEGNSNEDCVHRAWYAWIMARQLEEFETFDNKVLFGV
ncbi:RdRP-domain-containing protein, partial [Atractiella rhizophila]